MPGHAGWLWCACVVAIARGVGAESAHAAVDEISRHFTAYDSRGLDALSLLLLKIKQTAHRNAFGDRAFGHDAVEDSKKEISISSGQPDVSKTLSPFLYEGDILLSQKQAEGILENLSKSGSKGSDAGKDKDKLDGASSTSRRRRSFHADPLAKWMKQPIKYRFHDSLAFYEIAQILKGIRFWEESTCVTFERIDNLPDDDYIEFFKGQGCYSMIGRVGGRQGVSIGQNCVKMGVIEHEIGHALGLWHEQSRPDAPAYIKFILPSYISDFEQQSTEIVTLGVPYDLGSVMHYGPAAFSIDKKSTTLETKDPFYQSTIGQRETLSFYDIKTVNIAYCSDKCSGTTKCQHGGYPHPSDCSKCICPMGLGGETCEAHAPPQKAECGGVLTVTSEWQSITSPGFPEPGYVQDQKCAWLLKAPTSSGERIEVEFVEDFSFLCTSTCVDFVELKISSDLANTGFRFCCYNMPSESFVSETATALVIFRSQLSTDVGFKLRYRTTTKPAKSTIAPPVITTTTPSGTGGGVVWSTWGEWSQCSRTCGGCGIKSRVRSCPVSNCEGRRQEFSTCNLVACPVDKHCAKLLSHNKLCNGKICTSISEAIAGCDEPLCCPPFFNVNGVCQSDDPILNDFIDL